MQPPTNLPSSGATASIVALAVAMLGHGLGEYAVILLGAMSGALWVLSRKPTVGHRDAALLVLRVVLTSVVLTSAVAWWLESRWALPMQHTLAPVAAGIALWSDRLPGLGDWLLAEGKRRITGQAPEATEATPKDEQGGKL